MNQTFTATGRLSDARTITLDSDLPVAAGRVQVVLAISGSTSASGLVDFLQQCWEEQLQRGDRPRSKEEVDAYLQAERASWNRSQ